MDRAWHYARTESLIERGMAVVSKLSDTADGRKAYGSDQHEYHDLTRQMDEYGKKAMGIWAQAQVHATLASGNNDPPRLTAARIEAREAGIQHDGDRP